MNGAAARAAHAKPGPQIGAPPSLEQVPLDRLQVDDVYQRAVDGPQSRRIIRRMVQEWNWALCQPLAVSRRDDGGLFVLDGQHRLQGARERGDILYLPCVISSGLDLAGEARTFVKINTERQKLGENDVFFGMLAANDEHAAAVQALLAETGWFLARHRSSNSFRPGELLCAPMLVKMLKARGPGAVQFALNVLRAAYPETGISIAATLLAALGELFDGGDAGSVTAAGLAEAIGAILPRQWLGQMERRLEKFPFLSKQRALAQAMAAAAQAEHAAAQAEPAAPVPSTGHPAIATRTAPTAAPIKVGLPPHKSNPFGAEGKGWCEQCDQLCSQAQARACTDRFCSLRAGI